jgi:hypothetical protein
VRSRLAIVIEYGFHDIKKYIHSGLATELSNEFDIVWLVLDKQNDFLNQYINETRFPIVYISESNIIAVKSQLENYNQSIRRSWMVNKGLGIFHNYQFVRTKSIKTAFIGNSILKYVFEKLTLKVYKKYVNEYLISLFTQEKIDKVIFISYNSILTKNIVASADSIGIDTYCIVNSWKDLYVNNFMPFVSVKKVFVWDNQMKEDYLFHMPYLKPETIVVTGNPTFDYLIDSKPKYNRTYYSQKYNIPLDSIWLYYTMLPPSIVDDEIDTISFISKELLKHFGEQFIVLVRRNPNHALSDFSNLKLPDNVRLTKHFCTFDAEKDMLVQTHEGEQEWLDLLHHTAINLSVPSTVTKEFLLLGKPVLNIAFNKLNQFDDRLMQFFEAGFYRNLFSLKNVIRVQNIDFLLNVLKEYSYFKQTVKFNYIKSSRTIVEQLKNENFKINN